MSVVLEGLEFDPCFVFCLYRSIPFPQIIVEHLVVVFFSRVCDVYSILQPWNDLVFSLLILGWRLQRAQQSYPH